VDGDVQRWSRTAIFVLDAPVEVPEGSTISVRLAQTSKEQQQTFGHFRLALTDQAAESLGALDLLPGAIADALQTEPAQRTASQAQDLHDYFRFADAATSDLRHQMIALRRQALDLSLAGIPVMVMQEMPKRRDTYLLKRGQYDQPDKSEKLEPGLPVALTKPGTSMPTNRLEFARWLVSTDNPLTARVEVNRYWQMYFGVGLVKTSEDFGSQGEAPINQDLLDYLATQFIVSGWDIKAMQKLIVTSSAYRQSSKLTPALYEKDPENRLLARGPRFRLPSHLLRDNALAISGLLVPTLGGPAVKPYQPAGLWEELSFGNKTSVDKYV